MESYRVRLSRSAESVFEKIQHRDLALADRLLTVFESLKHAPYQGKALSGDLKGRYSYRVGVYRIIYAVIKERLIIYVIDIGHRRDIYR